MKRTGQQALIDVSLLFIGPFANPGKPLINLSVTAIARDFRRQPGRTGLT